MEKQKARRLCNTANVYQTPFPLPNSNSLLYFLNQSYHAANYEKREKFQPIVKYLYLCIV